MPTMVNAEDLARGIKRYESLRRLSRRDVQVAYDRLHLAVAIKYYLDRARAIGPGLNSPQVGIPESHALSLLDKITDDVQRDGGFLFSKAKDDRAVFQYFRYTVGEITSESLRQLAKILGDSSAPPALKYRVYFTMLYFGVTSEEAILNPEKTREIEKKYYNRAKRVSPVASVASALALASAYGGVWRGQKIRQTTDPQYQVYIAEVAKQIHRMDEAMKEKVLAQLLVIWYATGDGDNKPLPFGLSVASGTTYYYPLMERESLAGRQLKIKSTGRIYGDKTWQAMTRRLATQNSLAKFQTRFLSRLLEDRKLEAKFTRKIDGLEQEIHWQMMRVQKRRSQGKVFGEYYNMLSGTYRALVAERTILALRANVPQEQKTAYLLLVDRYFKRVPVPVLEKADLLASQARVLTSLRQLSGAVRKYMAAYKIAPARVQKLAYLNRAIATQRTLTRWPAKPPFGVKMEGRQPLAVKALADLYKLKLELAYSTGSSGGDSKSPKQNDDVLVGSPREQWIDTAQYGLLLIYLRRDVAAADLFMSTIEKFPQGAEASAAAYTALQTYQARRLWSKLERLSLLLGKTKTVPRIPPKTIDPRTTLAMALLEGGRQLYRQKNYEEATDKLSAFIKLFPGSAQVSVARYDLALSYWGSTEHLEAMNEMQTIARHDKKFKNHRKAILTGIQWSQALAVEEATIFFSESYIRAYKDRTTFNLQLQLRRLYSGTDRYRESLANLSALKASPYASMKQKEEFDLEMLSKIKKYGNPSESLKITDGVLAQSKSPRVIAETYKLRAAIFAERRDAKKLADAVKRLEALTFQTTEIREARGTAMLALLRLTDTRKLEGEVQSIALRSPESYLKNIYQQYTGMVSSFNRLCGLGVPSKCLEGTAWWKDISDKFIDHITAVEINESLSPEVKMRFKAQKAAYLSDINKKLRASEQRSSSLMSSSGGTPQAVLSLLWSQEKDWNFDPLTWGQSSGYIFWEMGSGYSLLADHDAGDDDAEFVDDASEGVDSDGILKEEETELAGEDFADEDFSDEEIGGNE